MEKPLKKSLLTDSLKGQLVGMFVSKLMMYAISKVAFLSFGPVGWIVSKILTKITMKLLENGVIGINNLIINIDIKGDVVASTQARREAIYLVREGGATDEELDAIDKEIEDSSMDLIKFGRIQL